MDAIIILGAAVWADGPSPTLRRRTLHAARLWHNGAAPQVIPCGGLGQHGPTEAEVMRQLLISEGVHDDQIILEDQSKNTLENLRNAKHLLSGDRVLIVTDHYHGPRAAMVARHFGLQATILSPSLKGTHLPTQLRNYLREAGAIPAYALRLRVM